MRQFNSILITGGCGFIGSNFIRYLLEESDFTGHIVNVDSLTYAGNPESLADIADQYRERYQFEKADICDIKRIDQIFDQYQIDCVIHFAAESHVDRSIFGPKDFVQTNVIGSFNLLEIARKHWGVRLSPIKEDLLFHHISTDEVFGSLDETGYFYEDTVYDPRSPYSASKAASDHLVNAYFHTYSVPITISNCSNNYGPYQFPEKLIPLMILNMLEGKPLPIYGDGKNVRDWLYVGDHCRGIWRIVRQGKIGETYNIGGNNEQRNIDLINRLCEKIARATGKHPDELKKLIAYVPDRLGHDRRYAVNCDKIKSELGWEPAVDFDRGLDMTVAWYLSHQEWIDQIRSGGYQKWIETNYDAKSSN
ncbi:MAG: dTDP-glucose 4,6-dehydratase [Candidatus Cloacimonetes bacterium 4572_55]|nr:MAG: dTDP-glucose 4,6-dehydratase [Candidatus Cloacimonetes bacterium 4572_55]